MKLAIPLAMATVGVGAGTIALVSADDASPAAASQVWIDAPTGIVPFAPGEVVVTAHATASDAITGLTLLVDGEEVATDDTLERADRLVYAELAWEAPVGTHELVVEQVGGTGDRSAVRTVVVTDGAAPAPTPDPTEPTDEDEPTTTTTTEPAATTTTAPGETTTTGPEETTTTLAPPEGEGTIPPTVPTTRPPTTTTTRPTTTTTRPAAPVVDSAAFVGTPTVYAGDYCPSYTVGVQVRARNATGARITVSGTSFSAAMSRSSSTFSGTIPSGWPAGAVGTRTVSVVVTGPGGSATAAVGTLTIRPGCPKD
jgi:hypothetical protein